MGDVERRRILKLLLVGNPYDAFLLEDAGFGSAHSPAGEDVPRFELVRGEAEAMAALEREPFDMVLVDHDLPDTSGPELAKKIRKQFQDVPVTVLTSNTDLGGTGETVDPEAEPNLFIWYGAPSLLRALVKLAEDEINAPSVLNEGNALVILLVEDEPNFYSHFVTVLYERIRESALSLIPGAHRPNSSWAVIDNRPLVLLRRNFEDACKVLYAHERQLMALITDMRFPVHGELKGDAGLRLLYRARSINGHLPVALHSRENEHRRAAKAAQARFLSKDSSRLLTDLDHFLINFCGFGPFVFRWPGGERYGVARNLADLLQLLQEVPDVVFEYHALHSDFSTWLAVHGHLELAARVRAQDIHSISPRADVVKMVAGELKRTAEWEVVK